MQAFERHLHSFHAHSWVRRGKSTFLKLLDGSLEPTHGFVRSSHALRACRAWKSFFTFARQETCQAPVGKAGCYVAVTVLRPSIW